MATVQPNRCSRADLLIQAFWVMERRVMWIQRSFDQEEPLAIKALRRMCKGWSRQEYSAALRKGAQLVHLAAAIVNRHERELLAQTHIGFCKGEATSWPDFRPFAAEMKSRCPGYRLADYRDVLLWIFINSKIR